jgi:antitoxin FitA
MNAPCLQNDGVTVALTIRDVPDDVRDALSRSARERGQSLQAFLLGLLTRQAEFSRNREILAVIDRDLAAGGGVGADAPDAADVLAAARPRQNMNMGRSRRPAGGAPGAA